MTQESFLDRTFLPLLLQHLSMEMREFVKALQKVPSKGRGFSDIGKKKIEKNERAEEYEKEQTINSKVPI